MTRLPALVLATVMGPPASFIVADVLTSHGNLESAVSSVLMVRPLFELLKATGDSCLMSHVSAAVANVSTDINSSFPRHFQQHPRRAWQEWN